MKKIVSMILIFILGFTFIIGRPKLNPAAAAHEPIDLSNVVHYLPKRDEEITYWTSNMA